MIVLGIDTSTLTGSVAIVEIDDHGARVRAERDGGGAHASELLVMIDAACRAAGLSPHELDAIAIGAGPGSFTGLRIGMATAKGLAFATACPLWAVSSLAAIAHRELAANPLEILSRRLGRTASTAPDPGGVVIGVLDARRGEVYAGAYRRDTRVVEVAADRVMPPGELAAFGATLGATFGNLRYAGDADGTYPELASLAGTWSITPRASAVALLAHEGTRVDVLVGGAPSYVRPAEAEIKYPDGVPGALRRR